MKYLYLLMMSSLVCSVGFCGTIHPNHNDTNHIEFAQQSKFDCVLPLISISDDVSHIIASCVIIKQNIAITCAHIFIDSGIPSDSIYIRYKNQKINIEHIICHPEFDKNKVGYDDLAILKFDGNIDVRFPSINHLKNEKSRTASICGYGFYGNFDTGANQFDARKRAGMNTIDDINKHVLLCSPSRQNAHKLEFICAKGDSGGGLFIGNSLVGINSFVYTKDGKTDSSWTDISAHTRISIFKDWIKDAVNSLDQ